MPDLTEYGDFLIDGVDEWGFRKIDGLLEDGTKIISVEEEFIVKQWTVNLQLTHTFTRPFRKTSYTQFLNILHTFKRPFRTMKLIQTLNVVHVFSRPFRTIKLAQTLNTVHIFLRHRFMKLTQALQTLHEWTLPLGVILKQWYATLQTTHAFKRPFRFMKLAQSANLTHIFKRPTRFMKLTQTLNTTHTFLRHRFMKFSHALRALHEWTLPLGAVLKQWYATLQATHAFKRPARFMKLTQTLTATHALFRHRLMRISQVLNAAHVFSRPARLIVLPHTLRVAHAFTRPLRKIIYSQLLRILHFWMPHEGVVTPFLISSEPFKQVEISSDPFKQAEISSEPFKQIRIEVKET